MDIEDIDGLLPLAAMMHAVKAHSEVRSFLPNIETAIEEHGKVRAAVEAMGERVEAATQALRQAGPRTIVVQQEKVVINVAPRPVAIVVPAPEFEEVTKVEHDAHGRITMVTRSRKPVNKEAG